jgi:hypothetical protein
MRDVLNILAQTARPIDDADYGSYRQVRAENRFFYVIKSRLTAQAWHDFELYCLKATSDERIDEALRLVRRLNS